MHPLSAVIITYNEEINIGRCIEALLPVADEIIVVDSFSKDNTVSIARNLGAKIIQNEWLGFGPQKNLGVQAAAHNNIIALDADEIIDAEAARQISILKEEGFNAVYEIKLYHYYFGKFLRHGQEYPNFKKRIFCKDRVNWNMEKVHESLIIPAGYPIVKLGGRINHYSYNSLEQYLSKSNMYTTIAANAMFKNGKKGYFIKMIISPSFTFFKSYFLKLGLLDGMHGFVVAVLNGHTNFLKYAKLWGLKKRGYKTNDDVL